MVDGISLWIVWIAILTPGMVLFPRMCRSGLNWFLALLGAGLISSLWLVAVVMVLMATRTAVIPGVLWVMLLTVFVVVEAIARPADTGNR